MNPRNIKSNRKSIRLPQYDYAGAGYYFVTTCAHERQNLFGNIRQEIMYLNPLGQAAKICWQNIPRHYPEIKLDNFIIMPNHLHGILIFGNNVGAQNLEPDNSENMVQFIESNNLKNRAQNIEPLPKTNAYQHIISGSIGSVVRGFKIGVTKWAKTHNYNIPVWQRNYYEHIIRDEKDYENIWQYIEYNPAKWDWDRNNPKNF
ncbi:hypothetical protein GYA13_02845 [Candidatus Kuenenbacteria bacterium]|nr:hypothetical protein [Candidatus Kuenenbacteria bacterium]